MKDIIIDFSTQKIINGKIEAVQGDNTTRKVKILLKENSNPYNLTGKTVMLTMKKNSSNSYVNKGDFINLNVTNAIAGEVELPVNKAFTKEKGSYQLQISVINEADFEENTMLFEGIIHNNLREDVSETLVESVIFKEIKQTLQEVKDIAKNEEQRKANEQQRIKSETGREEFFNTQTKPATEKVSGFTEQVAKNTKNIERAFEVLNENSFVPYSGEDITIEHSKVGFTKDMKISGKTYQNLFDSKKILFGEVLPWVKTANGTSISFYYHTELLKSNTIYTVIVNISTNTLNNKVSLIGYSATTSPPTINAGEKGIIAKKFTTKDLITSQFNLEIWRENTSGDFKLDNYIILEGDYTTPGKYIPPYFEGIKSVGEAEGNKISILSSNSVDNKASNYQEYKKEIQLQQPLMGLKDIQDTIEETNEGVVLTQNIGKRAYEVGDENLPNVMTDKINTYYVLDNPKVTILPEIASLNMNTYNDITYIKSLNFIKPTLSFKAPVNTSAMIGDLREKNSMLLVKNEELQNKNVELEKVNQKQSAEISELNDTTNFLIEDALSRKLNN